MDKITYNVNPNSVDKSLFKSFIRTINRHSTVICLHLCGKFHHLNPVVTKFNCREL